MPTVESIISFTSRLAFYGLMTFATGSYIIALALYYIVDLLVIDYLLKIIFGLEKVAAGLDANFISMNVNTCYYVVLDQRIENIKELKKQIIKCNSS